METPRQPVRYADNGCHLTVGRHQLLQPYRLKIKSFITGGDYTLRLIGNGTTNEEYSTLVKHVTALV